MEIIATRKIMAKIDPKKSRSQIKSSTLTRPLANKGLIGYYNIDESASALQAAKLGVIYVLWS
jgi:hypothetical protein